MQCQCWPCGRLDTLSLCVVSPLRACKRLIDVEGACWNTDRREAKYGFSSLGYQSGDCGYCKAEDSSQRTPDSRALLTTTPYHRNVGLCRLPALTSLFQCSYCHDILYLLNGVRPHPNPSLGASYYARSKSLCPKHYQLLMDRGWRRSGTLLYLPDAARSCCPHYTIRYEVPCLPPER